MVKNILIVEDEPKISEFISSYIRSAGYHPLNAKNGLEALDLFRKEKIDLILLDLMLPDLSGESVCKSIRAKSEVPIIMITAKSDEESIISGLKMGADDYMTKPFSPRQMIARIQALFRRSEGITKTASRVGPFEIIQDQYIVTYQQQDLGLTMTEYQLFTTLLKRPSKVFTRDELAENAFERIYEGLNRSIDSHIKNIRMKITALSTDDYIRTVRGIGYQYHEKESCD